MNQIGIRTLLSAWVKEIKKGSVHLENKDFLLADQVAWTTGIKGADFLNNIEGVQCSKRSQLIVTPRLQILGFSYVFAMGDCSSIQNNPVPSTAQMAT